jgi:hypothetical protein
MYDKESCTEKQVIITGTKPFQDDDEKICCILPLGIWREHLES